MRGGKTTEGYDLLSGIKLLDLKSFIDPEPCGEANENYAVMDVLVRAAKRGDQGAIELLVFGELESSEVGD